MASTSFIVRKEDELPRANPKRIMWMGVARPHRAGSRIQLDGSCSLEGFYERLVVDSRCQRVTYTARMCLFHCVCVAPTGQTASE